MGNRETRCGWDPLMFRIVQVLLTIASLLICPFNCMAKVSAKRTGQRPQAGCACCQTRCSPPSLPVFRQGSTRPCPHSQDTQRCDCLCRGTLDPSPKRPVIQCALWALAPFLTASAAPYCGPVSASVFTQQDGPAPWLGDSCRAMRVAIHSLVI